MRRAACSKGAGAESIDEAREKWWLGFRDVEQEHYERQGGSFKQDEQSYRRGFEAALQNPGKTCQQAREQLSNRYPDVWQSAAFRVGYERGHLSRAARRAETQKASSA